MNFRAYFFLFQLCQLCVSMRGVRGDKANHLKAFLYANEMAEDGAEASPRIEADARVRGKNEKILFC